MTTKNPAKNPIVFEDESSGLTVSAERGHIAASNPLLPVFEFWEPVPEGLAGVRLKERVMILDSDSPMLKGRVSETSEVNTRFGHRQVVGIMAENQEDGVDRVLLTTAPTPGRFVYRFVRMTDHEGVPL